MSSSCHGFMPCLLEFQRPYREIGMSLKNHLNELIGKHQALEKELADAIGHPASTDSQLAEIKRRKLRVKDEITRLERDMAHAA
jgi:hypothetical protein